MNSSKDTDDLNGDPTVVTTVPDLGKIRRSSKPPSAQKRIVQVGDLPSSSRHMLPKDDPTGAA